MEKSDYFTHKAKRGNGESFYFKNDCPKGLLRKYNHSLVEALQNIYSIQPNMLEKHQLSKKTEQLSENEGNHDEENFAVTTGEISLPEHKMQGVLCELFV